MVKKKSGQGMNPADAYRKVQVCVRVPQVQVAQSSAARLSFIS